MVNYGFFEGFHERALTVYQIVGREINLVFQEDAWHATTEQNVDTTSLTDKLFHLHTVIVYGFVYFGIEPHTEYGMLLFDRTDDVEVELGTYFPFPIKYIFLIMTLI